MATYRNFEDVMDEKFRRLMGDFGDLTVERRRLAWGGKKLKTGDEQDGMAGKGGFIGYSSGYRYRTRRAPRHGTIGYNVDSYYDVYVDDYFDEDVEPVPEPIAAPPPPKAETPVDPNLFAQDFIDAVPAVVDPVTTFNEEEFKHLEWDQDVVPVEDTFVPEPPEVPEGTGVYATVGADGVLKLDDGSVFEVLANGVLKAADGAIWAATGVILSTENALVESVVAFEGKTALADAVALAEGRKLVVKEQPLASGEALLSWTGGSEFRSSTGAVFRRLPDGRFVGDGSIGGAFELLFHAGVTITGGVRIEGELTSKDGGLFVGGVRIPEGALVAVSSGSSTASSASAAAAAAAAAAAEHALTAGELLMLRPDGSLVDAAGSTYSVTPAGLIVDSLGNVIGATGQLMTPGGDFRSASVAVTSDVITADGAVVEAGSKIMVKRQVAAGEGLVVLVGADGGLVGIDGKKYTMRADGKIVAEDNKVYKGTGKVVTAAQSVLTGASAALVDGVIQVNGQPLLAGAKIVIDPKEEEEEELEPPPKPVTIKGEVVLKDIKGDIFAEIHKDDVDGTIIGAESVIIIKNAKGKEVVRITRGYVTVKNFNVEEIVQIMRGVVSVKTIAGKEMVHVEKGEIYIEDFDGEVIVNNLADVNKLDEEMSLKNM